ncbi:hypothetical protein BJY52DRAFT_1221089 [Lactarius psammicola]|nr:hypothetical protein BJY52DRAFT_1221089 [Lactarius psammicola]
MVLVVLCGVKTLSITYVQTKCVVLFLGTKHAKKQAVYPMVFLWYTYAGSHKTIKRPFSECGSSEPCQRSTANTLPRGEQIVDPHILFDMFPGRSLLRNRRAHLVGQIPLGENVLGEVTRRKADSGVVPAPERMHGVTIFQLDDRAPVRVDKVLLEDVVEDVLEVEELGAFADLDQLCSHRLLRVRRLVVGDPELWKIGVPEDDKVGQGVLKVDPLQTLEQSEASTG